MAIWICAIYTHGRRFGLQSRCPDGLEIAVLIFIGS